MSIHLLNSNSVFFQIPKTGGRWTWKAMENSGIKFINQGSHNTYVTEDLIGKKSFVFVRRPIEFYKSYWCYRTENKTTKWYLEQYCWSDDFEEYLCNIIKHQYPYVTQLYRSYIGEPQIVDYIGHQENLTEDLITILKMLDEDFDEQKLRDTPRENVSRTKLQYSKHLELGINLLEKDVINKYYYGTKNIIHRAKS